MEPRIITKEAFPVIGMGLKTTVKDDKSYLEIPQFWVRVMKAGDLENIPNKKDRNTTLGICMEFEKDGSFLYVIGSEVTKTDEVPDNMVLKTIPACRYAVFTAKGQMPDSIQNTMKYIYNEWLPNSGYKRANAADLELYDERADGSDASEMDIYIPITKE